MKTPTYILAGPSVTLRIHTSGPLHTIEDVCRRYCLKVGLCVTVTPTRYIYTGGEETGAVVELIAYPRFPEDATKLEGKTWDLANELLESCSQQSILIQGPKVTFRLSTRPQPDPKQ